MIFPFRLLFPPPKPTKKECTEQPSKAYTRLLKLINQLFDLNPTIREIRKSYDCREGLYHNYKYNFYSVETELGIRFLKVCNDEKYELSLAYGIIKPFEKTNFDKYGLPIGKYEARYFNKLFKVTLKDKSIKVEPNLDCSSVMNEEQIYLALVEIENIIKQYEYPTQTEEHKANLVKFVQRLNND